MSATRFFSLYAVTDFCRLTAKLQQSFRPIQFSTRKLISSPLLRFSCHTLSSSSSSSSSVAETLPADCTSESSTVSSQHPWPEWVAFVDRLKTKGYFADTREDTGDMGLLKAACLCFARDRYDILTSLSTEDIQAVVQKGCPDIKRKTVNSGKRLRAYLQLDEGEVCNGCNLRGSCDRAYLILKDSESNARTVDIVRILLSCALDPVVMSVEKPPGVELLEVSARKLLSELTELSYATPDPNLPKPPLVVTPKKPSLELQEGELSRDVEMKRGDWMCPKCNFLNFARNRQCHQCKEAGPRKIVDDGTEMKKGDWNCSKCNFMNFARNIRCLKCKADGPKRISYDDVEMKPGDWNCPECHFMNFSSNKKCLRCQVSRPKRQLNPGEWECPSCDFLNFRNNTVCRKCNYERPEDRETSEGQRWRKPVSFKKLQDQFL